MKPSISSASARCMLAAALFVSVFGLVMMLAPSWIERLFSMIIFGQPYVISAFGDDALAYIHLIHGILGAVILGWAVALFYWRACTLRARGGCPLVDNDELRTCLVCS